MKKLFMVLAATLAGSEMQWTALRQNADGTNVQFLSVLS